MKNLLSLLVAGLFCIVSSPASADHRIVLDDADPVGVTVTGSWTSATADSERFGQGYLHDQNSGKGSKSVVFTPTITIKGKYLVYVWWPADAGFDDEVEVTVESAGSPDNLQIDQTATGGQWVFLGEYTFNTGTEGKVTIANDNTSFPVVADAVMFVLQDEIVDNDETSKVDVIGSWTGSTTTPGFWGVDYVHDGNTSKGSKTFWFLPEPLWPGRYDLFLRWTSDVDRADNVPVEVESAEGTDPLEIDQQTGGGEWVKLGEYSFDWSNPISIGIGNAGTSGYVIADAVRLSISGFVVDNADAGFSSTGSWTTATSPTGFEGANFLHDGDAGKGSKTATFEAEIAEVGWYTVFLKWTSGSDRAEKVPVSVDHEGGTSQRYVNQKVNGGEWVSVGTWVFDTDGAVTIENDSTSGYVVADAVKWSRVYDGDFDGVSDAWETLHGMDFTDDLDAAEDPDGDGKTNLEEFEESTDPQDYYNGVAPNILLVSGNLQSGSLDAFLAEPLVVRVLDGESNPLENAPVVFEVMASSAKLSIATSSEPELASLTLRTDANGYVSNLTDSVYLKLPSSFAPVEVTATAGTESVTFSVDTDSDGMPDGFEIDGNLDPFVNDALADKDGDRVPNIFEYVKGTDPDDDTSIPVADIEVDAGGSITTIQDGLNLVTQDYQIVGVAAGVYSESITIADYKTLVRSDGGPLTATISLSGEGSVVNMYASGVVEGFTIRHENGLPGAGMIFADEISSRIGSCIIEKNDDCAAFVGIGTQLLVENTIIRENKATFGTLIAYGADVEILNSTFVGNEASGDGHALWVEADGTVTIKNSIVWDVADNEVLGIGVTVTDSIVRGGFTGSGNSDQDPLLTRGGYLTSASPAIGMAGTGSSIKDIRGVERDMDVDSGADEFTDTDSDGMADWWEILHGLNPSVAGASADGDSDNLTDLDEYLSGTDPGEADSDGDGWNDDEELLAGSDPVDGDTDDDQMPDGYEDANGLNPLTNDALADKDGDRIPNLFEYHRETDPSDDEDLPASDVVVDPLGLITTIGAGLGEVTEDYQIVEVAPGEYAETALIGTYKTLLISSGGPDVTTINVALDSDSCVYFTSSGVVDGFTLTHNSELEGPGVLLADRQVCRVSNCIIRNNEGSAVYAGPGSYLLVENCVLRDNLVAAGTVVAYGAEMDVESTTFLNNSASIDGHAVWEENGICRLRNCIVWNVGENEILGMNVAVTDSIIRGGLSEDGNIDSDPLLNSEGYPSPASDAADWDASNATVRDIKGTIRDEWPDIGAIEYVATDGDGIPDPWELDHGLDPEADNTSTDLDEDGITDADEYTSGSDPEDFYNGVAPRLTIVSGNNQYGNRSALMALPLVVKVTDSNDDPIGNAPVRFEASTYRAKFFGDSEGLVPLGSNVVLRTDSNGLISNSSDALYVQLPIIASVFKINATALEAQVEFDLRTVDQDTDGDGMTDDYETASGLDLFRDDALEDKDGDRIPNIYESVRRTSSNSAVDKPLPDITVGSDGADYTTILEALQNLPGEFAIVEVAAGTYEESFWLTDTILLLSRSGYRKTFIEANVDDFGVLVWDLAVIDGFSVTHDEGFRGSAVGVIGKTAILNCHIHDSSTAGDGGGIYGFEGCDLKLVNTIVANNHADNFGGGIMIWGRAELSHCTFVGNTTDTFVSGAVFYGDGAESRIVNSIFYNTDDVEISGSVQVSSSSFSTSVFGTGNLEGDPALTATGHLTTSSPGIDLAVPSNLLYDIDLEPRVSGEAPDMGADELTPLAVPQGLSIGVSNGSITISWSEVPGATGYTVSRSTNNVDFDVIATDIPDTTYTDTGLTNGTTYYYRVVAISVSGLDSEAAEISAAPIAVLPPANLEAVGGSSEVSLTWDAVSGATSYTLRRSETSGGAYSVLQSGISTESYLDTTVTDTTTYYYVVSAVVGLVQTQNSLEASATPGLLPAVPVWVDAVAGTDRVRISWQPSDLAATYNVWRATSPGGTYTSVGTGISGLEYYDNTVSVSTTYYYTVTAENACGESDPSDEVSVSYVSSAEPPIFEKSDYYHPVPMKVVLESLTPDSSIRYTLDGSTPSALSTTVASGTEITIDQNRTLKMQAVASALNPSEVVECHYYITGMVAAGDIHSMALKTDGTVWTWGGANLGSSAQELLGHSQSPLRPALVDFATTKCVAVATGTYHSVALTEEGDVHTWGVAYYGGEGQLGRTGTPGVHSAVSALPEVKSIAAGFLHTLALTVDGEVYSWGKNSWGELGDGTRTRRTAPVQVKYADGTPLTGVAEIAAFGKQSFARLSDGRVLAWGLNSEGRLGIGTVGGLILNPTFVRTSEGPLRFATSVAAGGSHGMALGRNAIPSAYGINGGGQLGDGTTDSRPIATVVFSSAEVAMADVITLAAGEDHSMALTGGRVLYTWGSNWGGALGIGSTVDQSFPQEVEWLPTGVVTMDAGAGFGLAVTEDGRVWGLGANYDGQLARYPFLLEQLPVEIAGFRLFIKDFDYDGLDDDWELEKFGDLDSTGVGDDDSDGVSNQDEFLAGTNPGDYYDGSTPSLSIAGGDYQTGAPLTVLSETLKVRVFQVAASHYVNAPITFTVASGGAGVSAVEEGPFETSCVANTDENGVAEIFLKLGKLPMEEVEIVALADCLDGPDPSILLHARSGVYTLPEPWKAASVGDFNGYSREDSGSFYLKNWSEDPGATEDYCQSMYQYVEGDFVLIAKVETGSAFGGNAGITLRNDLSAASMQASVVVSASGDLAFVTRSEAGAEAVSVSGGTNTLPVWLKLSRSGADVSGYYSEDGSTWTLIASEAMEVDDAAVAGLMVANLDAAEPEEAHFSSVALNYGLVGWQTADIGVVGVAGSASGSDRVLSIAGAGNGISSDEDSFRFVYRELDGNGEIVVQLENIEGGLAGVMLREGLAVGSKFAAMTSDAAGLLTITHRASTDAASSSSPEETFSIPSWLKLVRNDAVVEFYASEDGTHWDSVGSSSVTMTQSVLVGIAVSSLDDEELTAVTCAHASTNLLNQPWLSADVGNVPAEGNVTEFEDVFEVSGSGDGLTGTADQFRLLYRLHRGDGSLVAKIADFPGSPAAGAAGIILRDSLAEDATFASVVIEPDGDIKFVRRLDAGASVSSTSVTTATVPQWLKISREGAGVEAFYSSNGTTWTSAGTATVEMADTVAAGLAVFSEDPAAIPATIEEVGIATAIAPWQQIDIGSVGPVGSAEGSNSSYRVEGSGDGVVGTADALHLVYQELDDDSQIIARVLAHDLPDSAAQAGISFRETVDDDSVHASVVITGEHKAIMRVRTSTAGSTETITASGDFHAPCWVRIARDDDDFSGFISLDGVTWTLIATRTVSMPSTVKVGMAIGSGGTIESAAAEIDSIDLLEGIDADGDGLSSTEETGLGTSDADSDSDNDGIPDGVEADVGLDPDDDTDADDDLDGDGVSNLDEYLRGSDPSKVPGEDGLISPELEVYTPLDPIE